MARAEFLSEDQILDKGFRKQVIHEMINEDENLRRKFRELRKHEIYRDKNRKWVMRSLQREALEEWTLHQMRNRATNISVCRKVIDKLARAYTGGVTRTVADASSLESIDQLADELDWNTHMKKADRYRQLFRNTLAQIVPVVDNRFTDEDEQDKRLMKLVMRILAPWEYDILPDPDDPTIASVVILATFPERWRFFSDADASSGNHRGGIYLEDNSDRGDRREQAIADSPEDEDAEQLKARTFVWWSTKYHFTTDLNGEIVSAPDQGLNPIETLPFINITGDQDGHFWAQGGEDVPDMSIQINKKATDINFITFVQGWGQMVIAAKGIPKKLRGGPDRAFMFEMKEGDPTPLVEFATSNPPIASWLESLRSDIALLLSTNDLSTRAISANLNPSNVASGVALLIENAEVLSDIKDIQTKFQDWEPEMWEVLRRWHEKLSKIGRLTPTFQEILPFTDSNVQLIFHELKPPISEKEQLELLKLRKELGLNTEIELLRRENPDLTDEQAAERLKLLKEEKLARTPQALLPGVPPKTGETNESDEQDEEEGDEA